MKTQDAWGNIYIQFVRENRFDTLDGTLSQIHCGFKGLKCLGLSHSLHCAVRGDTEGTHILL